MDSKTIKRSSVLAVSTSLFALCAPAYAQLDEIVVTAQKREQSLQDVPISINAFDADDLEKKRIDGLEDIAQFSPGVYTTPNPADETGVRVNIRGIGTFDPQIGQDSRTAIYVDGVYYGRTQGLAFDSPDLGRVEILKGPQGTLYGRNTVSGAVNIISVAPSSEALSGSIDVEVGNFEHRRLKGHINVPLGDTAAFRLSGLISETDGWVENTGVGENFGGTERKGARAAFRFEPSEQLTVDLAADYTNTQSTPLFHQALPGTNNPGAFLAASLTPSPDFSRQESVNSFTDTEFGETEIFGLSGTANYELSDTNNLKLILAYREADSTRFVSLAPTANPAILAAIAGQPAVPGVSAGTGFNAALAPLPFAFGAAGQTLRPDFGSEFLGPLGTPADTGIFLSAPGGASTLVGHEQFSAELTYTGETNSGNLQYTAGLFYYDEQTGNAGGNQANTMDINSYLFVLGQFDPRVLAPNLNGFLDTVDLAPGFPGVQALPAANRGPIPVAGVLLGQLANPANAATASGFLNQLVGDGSVCGPTDLPSAANNFCLPTLSVALGEARQSAANTLTIDTEAFAIYGEVTWHVNDRLRLTGGLRYSDDQKDGVGQASSPFFLDNVDLTGNVIPENIGQANTESIDPSIIVEFDASDDILLYGSYKESFRSGGFNAAAVGSTPPGATSGSDFVFGDEQIAAYELGFKGDFVDNRFRFNASAYYYEFTDFQTTVSLNPLIATSRAIVNTDQEIWGLDLETVFAVTENLTATASYAFVDGEVDDVQNPNGAVEVRDELQGTPQNSYTIGVDYARPLSENHEFIFNASYSYKDDALAIPPQGAASEIRFSEQNLLSGRIGVNFDLGDNEAVVALWGRNLLDDEYTIDGLPFNTFAFNTAVFGQPRTYGISVGYKF